MLVVDDAYFEYVKNKSYSSGMKLFFNSKNVIITRTFSKLYGLAGLRIGWGYGPKKLIYALNQIKPPFNVNRPGLFAAAASVKDTKWLKREIKHTNRWAKIFYTHFKKLGIETNFSYANFLLINFDKIKKNSKNIFLKLAKSGIIVRTMDVYKIKNSLRVTIGTSSENRNLLKTMQNNIKFEKISIIGCGLIGSSILRNINKKEISRSITVFDKSKEVIDIIKKEKLCDEISRDIPAAVKDSDLIILCVPLSAYKEILLSAKDHFKENAIITDKGSVKK